MAKFRCIKIHPETKNKNAKGDRLGWAKPKLSKSAGSIKK